MASPSPQPQRTFLGNVSQLIRKQVHRRANFSKLVLRTNARVPKVYIQEGEGIKRDYPLLGDRYLLGRSSSSCDIVIKNPVVSQVHASIRRNPRYPKEFLLKDEKSTNGIFLKQRRIKELELRHQDVVTFGPADLENAVKIEFHDPPTPLARLLRTGFYGVTAVSALIGAAIAWEWQNVPVNPLPAFQQGPVIILARDGTSLTPERSKAHIENKSLNDFSPNVISALLASEDSRYYWHPGVDPIGTARALITNLRGGEIREGGSTVTQQLARSIYRDYVGTEDSIGRKIREAVVALKLETFYSKDFLLLQYLNNVYLGIYANGFEDAAQFYFDKSAQDLTVSEAATLVGILPAPNSFNPVQDYDAAIEYRDRVITRMAQQGRISRQEAARARRSRLEISPRARQQLQSTLAPYYYSYVFTELEDLLGQDLVNEGNFIVETGLDPRVQQLAEESLQRSIATDGAALGFSQGAVITLNFKSGEILAMVGGVDFQQSQFNRATQALRQPGSTFKLFAYAAAVNEGISPGKSYSCAPLTWQGFTYDGCRTGAASLNMFQGLALSENVLALRVAQDVGLDSTVAMAKRLGIESTLNPVPGLVLGQSEVTVLELSRAYAVVANGGRQTPALAIRKVFDAGDCTDFNQVSTCRVVFDQSQEAAKSLQVLDAGVAATMTQMLQGVVRGGTGGGAAIGLDEAGKTGTTNDSKDLWFVGYVPSRNLLTGVWLGNDDNAVTVGSSGQAAALWGDLMRRVVN
ncbi:transglycosylase domain-containing protein [Lyngbya confervoides]|uniref:Transglycosylase domain-containing protein n=1 Tax=Lyngbya confervoides BDU141951 TaxID=1574623 RepID=A0ABD4T476_9CYAN|nr:transglycosylase domain-containing protein [Lyngbya confervoides]MCM1983476.1 transglycosylase domain-containing protein [Lyngbya confervoides BDU141951]